MCPTCQLQVALTLKYCIQNIDRLHQAAGSTSIIELHGSLWDVCYPDRSAFHSATLSCLHSFWNVKALATTVLIVRVAFVAFLST